MVADIIQGDWIDAGVNFAGILIDAADAAKTSGKIGKFLLNNADNSALYAEILSFVNKNFPDALKYLGKNEDFVKATKKISLKKEDKITKKQHDELKEIFDKMGLDDLIDGGSETSYGINQLTKNKIEYVLKNHTFGRMKETIDKLMEKGLIKTAQNLLIDKSFFNPEWTEEKVAEVVNYVYNQAIAEGITKGEYTSIIYGEKITVCFQDGRFHTAYGEYKFSLSDFGY